MEKIKLYAIYDLKAERFDTPFFAMSDLFAERRFHIMIQENKSMFKLFKNDFVLKKIGEFELESGYLSLDLKTIIEGIQIGDMDNEISNET